MVSSEKDGEQLATELEFARTRMADLERQQAYFARIEKQIHHTRQMEAVGKLASGIAHNINNILTGIIGNLNIAYMKAPEEVSSYISKAMDESYRVANLISDLLAFSRTSEIEMAMIDANSVMSEVYDLSHQTLDSRIHAILQLDQEIPKVRADSAQLKIILMNLCMNAQDAILALLQKDAFAQRYSDRFEIVLKTAVEIVDDRFHEKMQGISPGMYVTLSVTDNGIGIESKSYERIFEPFYTTKNTVGTGLGLASAYGIIQQQGGGIDFVSQYGVGSTFTVYLPVLEDGQETISSHEIATLSVAPNRDECILIIDDEPMILSLCQGILDDLGYRVLMAENGQEGWEIFQQEKDHIDLILLDLSMPVVSGWDFLKMIRSSGSTVKIVVSSGYAKSIDFSSLQELGADGLISKPYYPRDLIRTIRQFLDRSEQAEK